MRDAVLYSLLFNAACYNKRNAGVDCKKDVCTCKSYFSANKRIMLDTETLQSIATQLIPNFDGVFPINELPITHKKSYLLIINTDPDNLPGTHWIAVVVRPDKEGFVFDSFGQPPPLKLQHWLNVRGIRWTSNNRQVQSINSTLCGYFCVYFLWFASSKQLHDEHFVNIMKVLFPPSSMYTYYDSIVNDFVNVMKI